MIHMIDAILGPDDVNLVREKLAGFAFEDGRRTAGHRAREVKSNVQASPSSPEVQALGTFVRDAIARNAVVKAAARPAQWSPILFSRYGVGNAYGAHVDDALMAAGLRSDLSFTLFLSDPDDYEGGGLHIETPMGDQIVRLAAGSAVIYPSGTIHQVLPVTKGTREVAVGWIQSQVRSAEARGILFDLANVRGSLQRDTDARTALLLDKVEANLLRMWAGA
jgi:PKHD-type hydroxylase